MPARITTTNLVWTLFQLITAYMKNPLYLLGQGRGVHPYTPEWFHPHFIPVEVLIGISFPCAAIALLQDKAPGTFVIRDSQSYTGAFGLAVKVEVPPMHVIQNQNKNFGKNHLNYFVMQVYVLDWKKTLTIFFPWNIFSHWIMLYLFCSRQYRSIRICSTSFNWIYSQRSSSQRL